MIVGATQAIFYNHTPLHNLLRQLILLMLLMIDTSHINNFPYQLKFALLGALIVSVDMTQMKMMEICAIFTPREPTGTQNRWIENTKSISLV